MVGEHVGGSFRDPSGFMFSSDGKLYRQINESYKDNYDLLMESGLYERLAGSGLLVRHMEVDRVDSGSNDIRYKTIEPELIPFISYPYEWCFSQLKDAALATLAVQKLALEFGMTLKDSSAYNIQFVNGKPVLIDTLSFEKYCEGTPWTPYGQFCRHFLAPLALMSLRDIRLIHLLRSFLDGIPLDLASSLLPRRSKFSSLLLHVHMHAKSQTRYSDEIVDKSSLQRKVSRNALLGLIDSLESAVSKLTWKPEGTEWADYYNDDSYTPVGLNDKQRIVEDFLNESNNKTVWDLGANNGFHSRLACSHGAMTVAFDVDPACVEMNYRQVLESGETSMLPLLLDLTNPSPAIGWSNKERDTIAQRGPVDLVMALALIHHLAISNNVPLTNIAEFLRGICESLIIEFVPKSDPKVRKLLATREDVFPNYTIDGFESEFDRFFKIEQRKRIEESERVLYYMVGK